MCSFNTTPHMGGFILELMQRQKSQAVKRRRMQPVVSKTGLMGPFAGVGDTIFGVLIPNHFRFIAAYMGQNGNVTGVVIRSFVNIAILIFRYFTTGIGYREGTKLVTSAKGC